LGRWLAIEILFRKVKRYLLALVLNLMGSWIFGQIPADQVRLSGTIVDGGNGHPIQGVHIICQRKAGTTTDLDGNFIIELSKGDTIRITHVGYNDYLVLIPIHSMNEYSLTIALTQSITELGEVTIYQWPATVSEFKQQILAMEIEDEDQVIIPGAYRGPPKPINPGFGSPISFIQGKLSKKIRRRREFLKKRQEIESHQRVRSRYNTKYVKEVTGIEDKHELEEFIEYCKFTDLFLGEVNDYDLLVAINQCYEDFKDERSE